MKNHQFQLHVLNLILLQQKSDEFSSREMHLKYSSVMSYYGDRTRKCQSWHRRKTRGAVNAVHHYSISLPQAHGISWL